MAHLIPFVFICFIFCCKFYLRTFFGYLSYPSLHFFYSDIHSVFKIFNLMWILFIHKRGMNHKIRCCNIICNRYIIHLCNSKKCLNIRIMWLCCQWIGEENIYKKLQRTENIYTLSARCNFCLFIFLFWQVISPFVFYNDSVNRKEMNFHEKQIPQLYWKLT